MKPRRRPAGARPARPRRAVGPLRPRPARAQGRAVRARDPSRASRRARPRRASSPPCARATCWSTTRTTRSRRACSASSSRRPPTRTCWRSSRRSTAPRATPPSSTRSSRPPRPASRSSSWSRSRRASTRRPTSPGPARWSAPAATSSTGWSGLKTHCKTALVVRREHGVLRRYCHIGTGNYNPKTARLYEDLGILTADPRVGADLTDLFNTLTGYSRQTNYRTLHGRAARHPDRADREDPPGGAARRRGPPVRHPVQAELAGRRADHRRALRGLDRRRAGRAAHPRHLRAAPGRPGLSENIRVRSIVGRFLEHSRVMSLHQRRRPGVLARQRRPHAPQPRPPGRGAAAGLRRDRPRRAAPDLRRRAGPGHPLLGARQRRVLDRTSDGRDYQAAQLERVGELTA